MKLFMVIQIFLLFRHHYGSAFQKISDAPKLPDLDYDNLPEFIRSMLPQKTASNDVTEDKKTQDEKSRPRTYGMSINGDNGVVWNDLLAPKSRYQIGNSRSVPAQDIDDVIDNLIDQITGHSTTVVADDLNPSDNTESTKPIPTTTEKPTTKEMSITESILTTPQEQPSIQDLAKTTPKPKTQKELLNEIGEKLDSILAEAAQYIKFPRDSNISEEVKDKLSETDENNEKTAVDERNKDEADIKDKNQDRKANNTQKPANIDNILELILQNEDIWSWLSKNIAKYLEILMDRMAAVVQEEVKLILQTHLDNNPCDCPTTLVENNTNTPELDKEDVDIDNDKINILNPNDTTEELPVNQKDKPTEANKAEKQQNCQRSESVIYGNSVGNAKVTNVFIFNMNSEGKPIIHYTNDSHTIDFNINSNGNEGNKTDNDDTSTATQNAAKDSEVAMEIGTESNISDGSEIIDDAKDNTEEPEISDDAPATTAAPDISDDDTATNEEPDTSNKVTAISEDPETNNNVTDTSEDISIDSTEHSDDSSEDRESNKTQDENDNNEATTEIEIIDVEAENVSEES